MSLDVFDMTSGYGNTTITIGDRILKIDGQDAENVDLPTLHGMLRGKLHSKVRIDLSNQWGHLYSVTVMRHGMDPLTCLIGQAV